MSDRSQRPGSTGGRWENNSYYSRYRPRQRQHPDPSTANPNNQPIGNSGSQYRPGSNYSNYDSHTYNRSQSSSSSYRGSESYYSRGYNKRDYQSFNDPHSRYNAEAYPSRYSGTYDSYVSKTPVSYYSSRNSRPNYKNSYQQQSQLQLQQQHQQHQQQTYYGQRPKSYGGQSESSEDFYDGKPSSTGSQFLRNDHTGSSRPTLITSTTAELSHKAEDEEADLLPTKSLKVSRSQQKPSLIPKDFKDDYNDDDDDEMERKMRGEASAEQTPDVTTDRELEILSEKLPLTTEHKEALDAESRDSSEEVQNEVTLPPGSNDTSAGLTEEADGENLKTSENIQAQQPTMEDETHVAVQEEKKEESTEGEDDYDPTLNEVLNEPESTETTNHNGQIEGISELGIKRIVEGSKVESVVEETEPSPELKVVTTPARFADSFMFPLPELESKLWELENQSRNFVTRSLPYLLKAPIKSFAEYPFYERNFLVHEQLMRPKLINSLSIIKNSTYNHKISLSREYKIRNKAWLQRLEEMKEQLRTLYPHSKPEQNKEQGKRDSEAEIGNNQSSRRRRHHGDSVRSEAEFLEILKGFEKEKEDDPLYRAEQLAAKIPDMILNPVERQLTLVNTNNLVADKKKWAERIKTDAINNFTPKEHEAFCEAFLATPKRFGRISAAMLGVRTPEECVLHYYKTKKTLTDYKQLLANKKKRKSKNQSKGKRGPKSKSNGSISNTPTTETPVESSDELGLENFIPKEVNEEVLYTETGRRRRAAAPSFDKPKQVVPEGVQTEDVSSKPEHTNELKRPLESSGTSNSGDAEPEAIISQRDEKVAEIPNEPPIDATLSSGQPVKKKQRGPKPKKHVEEGEIEPTTGDQKGKSSITSYWSVKDINHFASLLSEFGKNWQQISEKLKTKSPIMVRNYYQKNADSHGWRQIANISEKRLANQPVADSEAPGKQVQLSTHKNPPLGFFTAPTNVPSNISFNIPSTQVKNEVHSSRMLPSVTNLTLPIPQQEPAVLKFSDISNQVGRSNPFSITSLLNPPEDRKAVAPLPHTPNYSAGDSELYAGYREPASSLPNSVSTLKSPPSAPFNPLNALVAVASGDSLPWKQQKYNEETDKPVFDPVRPYSEVVNYNGNYQGSYSESSERGRIFNSSKTGRSILNPPPNPSPNSLPSIGCSNIRDLLINEPQEDGKN